MKIKVLVTGANGQLGSTLNNLSSNYDTIEFVLVSKLQLDITNQKDIESFFEKHNFQYCINCAAYTNVDQAETNVNKAFLVNATAVKYLALACKQYQVVLIHVSTDFVFDGAKTEPYIEEDIPNPINVYGASKLQGEEYIQKILDSYYILRTSWVYSEHGKNFVKTMLRLANEKSEIQVVSDQLGSPTYAKDLAEVIIEIIISKREDFGIYNYSNSGIISWFEFAQNIFSIKNKSINTIPIPTSDYKTPATRPAFSVLNTNKYTSVFKSEPKPFFASLKTCLKYL